MKKLLLLSIAYIGLSTCCNSLVNAQGIGINPSGNPSDPSALLDLNAAPGNNKGLLIPRLTTLQRDAISNPAEGLQIYNTDCKTFNYNAGTPSVPNWVTLNSSNTVIAGVTIVANPAGAVCAGATVTFTATPINGGSSPVFQWKVNGVNAGANSNIFATATLNNGDMVTCVLTSNATCVTASPAASNAITMLIDTSSPAQPGTISGSAVNLGNQTGQTYSISPVTFATSYIWTVPAGAIITAGQGGTSITVNFSCSAIGNIGVTASSACGSSPQRTLAVSTALPTPGTISGATSLASTGQMTGLTYSISAIPFATSYTWTVPSGATIVSGQGAISIIVDCPTGSNTSGTIGVTQTSSCGTSSQRILTITTSFPAPGAISGSTTVNRNSTTTYSISPVTNASSYTWSTSLGTVSLGQGTNSITVTWGGTAGTGSVSVVQNSVCGTSPPQTKPVNVGTQTFSFTGSQQTFTVPLSVISVTLDVFGGGGYSPGGSAYYSKGGEAKGTLTVTPGQVLNVYVGGGNGGNTANHLSGGGEEGCGYGGDGSSVRSGGIALANRVIVAGGGGGGGFDYAPNNFSVSGGDGGGNTGASGNSTYDGAGGGLGGSQSAGGAGGGAGQYGGTGYAGLLGAGGCSPTGYTGGDGGGGYYGGGSGGYDYDPFGNWCNCSDNAGGGGGSNYLGGVTLITNSQGVRSGNGQIIISW